MNPTPIKPMLGVKANINKLHYPLYVSTKLDGIRAIIKDNVVWSRSGKPIRNDYVQQLFSKYNGLDGELIVGNPTDPHVYTKTVSGVMTKEGTPDVKLFVFDCWNECGGIANRYIKLKKIIESDFDTKLNNYKHIVLIDQYLCINSNILNQYEEAKVSRDGYEGVMVRSPSAEYKHGRSTVKEEGLLKIKRFSDAEAKVIGFTERMHNANEAVKDELGFTTHSTCKDNLIGTNTLGSLIVVNVKKPIVKFNIGSGFTDEERKLFWDNKDCLLDKLVKYKYFTVGMKDAPRFPIFLGFRDPDDM